MSLKLDEKLKLARIELLAEAIISGGDCPVSKALATGIKVQLDLVEDSMTTAKGRKRATIPFERSTENGKITTREMAKILGRHEQTITKWVREGKLGNATPVKVGAGRTEGYVWDRDLVLNYVKDNLGGK